VRNTWHRVRVKLSMKSGYAGPGNETAGLQQSLSLHYNHCENQMQHFGNTRSCNHPHFPSQTPPAPPMLLA
jgi:hypothetical protein